MNYFSGFGLILRPYSFSQIIEGLEKLIALTGPYVQTFFRLSQLPQDVLFPSHFSFRPRKILLARNEGSTIKTHLYKTRKRQEFAAVLQRLTSMTQGHSNALDEIPSVNVTQDHC